MTETKCSTPLYAAPEVLEGDPATLRSDIWSFCFVIFELLADKPPYNGENCSRS
jgi:serine/threonine protein kinase